jgi:hypothetical protein
MPNIVYSYNKQPPPSVRLGKTEKVIVYTDPKQKQIVVEGKLPDLYTVTNSLNLESC